MLVLGHTSGDDMATTLTCATCGADLPAEHAGQSADAPCPTCGSVKKNIRLDFVDNVGFEVHDSLCGKLKDPNLPSKKNPRVDFFSGYDLRKSDGKWMQKERVLDKDNDHYKEIVIDPKTGEVIHHNEEPLSKYFGHGSAKFKKNDEA